MIRYIVGIIFIGLSMQGIEGAEKPVREAIVLTLPQLSWSLEIADPNLVLSRKETTENGKQCSFYATDTASGIIISGYLEERAQSGTPQECMMFYRTNMSRSPLKQENVSEYDLGESAILEYMVNEFRGRTVRQKNMHAYLTKDHYWMDIHLSKESYQDQEKSRFMFLVRKLRIVPKKSDQFVRVSYGISKEGLFRLTMPNSWYDEIKPGSANRPLIDIILTPGAEGSGQILVSVVWSRRNEVQFKHPRDVRRYVEAMGRKVLSQAVEKALTVRVLQRGSSRGYYFNLTDRAPKPGEYKYLTQGCYHEGKYLVLFTMLSNTHNDPKVRAALDMLSGSELVINRMK